MKVFITGVTNFIAHSIAKEFIKDGHDVGGSSRSKEFAPPFPLIKKEQLNLLDPESFPNDFSQYDLVIHLAWDYKNNLKSYEGTKALFEKAENSGVQKQLLISSYSAREDAISPYGKAKFLLEKFFLERGQYICRPGLVIGEGGLFLKIKSLTQSFPIIPVIDKDYNYTSIIEANVLGRSILKQCTSHNPQKIANLFYAKQFLIYEVVKEIVRVTRKKRILINTPLIIPVLFIKALNIFRVPFPISLDNLKGLQQNQKQTHKSNLGDFLTDYKNLNIDLPSLIESVFFKVTLEDEASFLFKSLFKKNPSADLLSRYREAHCHLFNQVDSGQLDTLRKVIVYRLDAQAIELCFRNSFPEGKRHLLTQKFHAIAYLAEFESEQYSNFVNEESQLIKGYLAGIVIVLTTILKVLKGKYLIKRYQLA